MFQRQLHQLLQLWRLEKVLPGRRQGARLTGRGRAVGHALGPAVGHGGGGWLVLRNQAAAGQGQRDGQTQVSDLHAFSPAAWVSSTVFLDLRSNSPTTST